MTYLLDTDTCIYALKGLHGVAERLIETRRSEVAVSVFTEAELKYGAEKSHRTEGNLERVRRFLKPLHIIPFESTDADVYAQIRADLARSGNPIGPIDTFIASHALCHGLIMVTNNAREFGRIDNLKIENWAS